jgi:CHAD domain-containing protein
MIPGPENVKNPVTLFLRERSRHLFRNLPLAMAGQEEPVHQIRVAARRLRATLPIAAPDPSGRRVRRALRSLRKLTRAAGTSRDMDVCLALLDTRIPGPRQRSAALRALRGRFSAARGRSRRRMAESFLAFDIARLHGDLGRILAGGGASVEETMALLHAARAQQGQEILEALQALGGRFEPAALHELRSRARRLRYIAELGDAILQSAPRAAKRLKGYQELLGELHDAWVLATWMRGQVRSSAGRGRSEEAAEAVRLAEEFERLARSLHARFLATRPEAALRRAISQIGRRLSVA